MNRNLLTSGGLIVAAILFVAVVLIANLSLRGARLDLTEGKLYTLSAGTKSVLQGLKEPVTLRFFFSEKLARDVPQMRAYGQRVKELLEEYAAQSKGKIQLIVVDPEPFSEAEDRAVELGLRGAALNQQGEQFYFGLAGTNSTDDVQTIPFFQQEREQFLEYELTRLVYALSDPKKPVIGLLTTLPMQGGPVNMMQPQMQPPWTILAQMRQVFDVKTVRPGAAKIDDDVAVLMVAHPKELPQDTLYAIDQFVLKGGKVLAFVDPLSEAAMQSQPRAMGMPAPESSTLGPLFDAWGIEFDKDKFVGDRKFATRVNAGQRAQRRQVIDYIAWLSLPQESVAAEDVVTGELASLNFGSAGALKKKEGASTTFTPLVSSSDDAMLVESINLMFGPDPERLLRDFKPSGERFALAARIQGPAKTAFPDGPPKAEAKEGEATDADKEKERPDPAAQLKDSKTPINVIVIADTDMLDDRFWVQTSDLFGERLATPFNGNGSLVINAIDNLTGSAELISLRSRSRSSRPFTVVADIRRAAEARFREEEKALQEKLEAAEKKIAELQKERPGSKGQVLTPEQRAAIEGFRTEMLETRKALRDVQHKLQRDIDRLAGWIKAINIGLIPLLVALVAVALAAIARQRRYARHAAR